MKRSEDKTSEKLGMTLRIPHFPHFQKAKVKFGEVKIQRIESDVWFGSCCSPDAQVKTCPTFTWSFVRFLQ